VGAVGALQLDRWMQTQRQRLRPNAVTGRLLDGINRRLEARATAETPSEPGF
jgi:hypothetical protein